MPSSAPPISPMDRIGRGAPFIGLTAEMCTDSPSETTAWNRTPTVICTGADDAAAEMPCERRSRKAYAQQPAVLEQLRFRMFLDLCVRIIKMKDEKVITSMSNHDW